MQNKDGLRCWTTEAVAQDHRLEYWVGAICDAFLELDAGAPEVAGFGGSLRSMQVDEVTCTQMQASAHDVYRTGSAISRRKGTALYLIAQTARPWTLRQGGQLVHLRPGDVALVDSTEPNQAQFTQGCGAVCIALPRPFAGKWLRQVDGPKPRIAWREQGWGRTLSALCLQLGDDLSQAAHFPGGLFGDHLGALLAASLEPAAPTVAGGKDLVQRAKALIQEQLDRSGLVAADLARDLHVSARTLHRAFSAEGLTVAGVMREARMNHALQLLASPRARLAVAQVAARCGYADASHFAREFRRANGMPPAQWRRRPAPEASLLAA
jgi:AraC family transcriptional regulator, positive regulator of tynA and feaB